MMGFGGLRVQRQSMPDQSFCFDRPSALGRNRSEIVQGRGMVGLLRENGAIKLFGFSQSTATMQCHGTLERLLGGGAWEAAAHAPETFIFSAASS
jgi:hypothetical protein